MGTLNLRNIAQELPKESAMVELFDALITEIGELHDRIRALENGQNFHNGTF